MLASKKICIFVDGENLRHSIVDLFPSFDRSDYLPKTDWGNFFDWIAQKTAGPNSDRIRTYWYVVEDIDFVPFSVNSARKDLVLLEKIFGKTPRPISR